MINMLVSPWPADSVLAGAFEKDVTIDVDACAKGVDARFQWMGLASKDATKESSSMIDPRRIGVKVSSGAGVCSLHGSD